MMGMMGCLGVWVTDAIEPEPEDYLEIIYDTDGTYDFVLYPINPQEINIDWGDNIIKRYSGTTISFTRFMRSGDTVRIYTPDNLSQILMDGGSQYNNVDLLINATEISIDSSTGNSFILPNDMSNLQTISWVDCYGLTTLTIGSGNTSLAYIDANGSSSLNSVNLPNDLSSITAVYLSGCNLSETSVNDILTILDASPIHLNGGVITLDGGTSAAPTGLGAAAAASLISKGVSVTTN